MSRDTSPLTPTQGNLYDTPYRYSDRETIMLGKNQKELTNFQEAVLHFMMLYERNMRDTHSQQGECTFASNFFTHLLGIRWQGYHNQAMDALAELGWITISQPSQRARFYRLTDVGREALRQHCTTASLYAWYI